MIELLFALAIMFEEIAKHADFFSFGTNDPHPDASDSRDDVESSPYALYLSARLCHINPFATLDKGVVRKGAEGGSQG